MNFRLRKSDTGARHRRTTTASSPRRRGSMVTAPPLHAPSFVIPAQAGIHAFIPKSRQ